MKCRLAIGFDFYDLAGSTGTSSDTQGLQVTYSVNAEQVAYIGVDEARQFFRPGSNVTASFSSTAEFSTVAECEAEIGRLYEFLKDQDGEVTAYLGGITYDGTNQVETTQPSGTASADGNVTVTVTQSSGVRVLTVPILLGDAATTYAGKIRTALAADLVISKTFAVTGFGGVITITSRRHQADAALNIAIDNGSPSPGITPVATSTNVQAGSADTLAPVMTIYGAIAQVSATYRGKSMTIDSSITGRTTS